MTEINISANELDDVLSKLWEKCYDEECYFRAYPKSKRIEVYTQLLPENKLIAIINVVNITDAYEVTSEIFK